MLTRLEFMKRSKPMAEKQFQLNEQVPVDAELMEAWLGGHKLEMSTKTMFDIQRLIEHYKDIIIPNDIVKVQFPTDENMTACASVDNKIVYIPTSSLEQGEVDDTIGLMIHELRHIEVSDSERQTWATCFGMVRKCLDTLFVKNDKGEYDSIHDIIFSGGGISFSDMMDNKVMKPNIMFLRQACRDVAFLLNAVEDVRIDTLTQPNLRKYITKGDDKAWEKAKVEFAKGSMDDDSLMNLCFRLLYHHKGYRHDDVVDKIYGDTKAILSSTPSEYTPIVLDAFKDVIRTHLEQLWESGDISQQVMKMFSDDPTDVYMNGVNADSESIEAQICNGDMSIKERAFDDTNALEWEDKECGETTAGGSDLAQQGGNSLRNNQDNRRKPKIVTQEMKNEIDAFSNIQIYYTDENFGAGETINYGCVVYDAV